MTEKRFDFDRFDRQIGEVLAEVEPAVNDCQLCLDGLEKFIKEEGIVIPFPARPDPNPPEIVA